MYSDHIEHYEHIFRLGRYWNKVVAVSKKIAEGVAEVNPALSDRLSVIPYGVKWKSTDLRRLQKAKEDSADVIRLAYAGRFVVEQKNIYEYIALADELHERKVPFEMCLCGHGPEYDSFLLRAAPSSRRGGW